MDKLEIYRNIIEKVINEYAAIPYAYGDIESRTMFDGEKDSICFTASAGTVADASTA